MSTKITQIDEGDVSFDQRELWRVSGETWLHPVSCILKIENEEFEVTVVNYHYRGACLKIQNNLNRRINLSADGDIRVDFLLHDACLKKDIPVRMVWMNLEERLVGIAFKGKSQTDVRPHISRAERVPTHPDYRPILVSSDPIADDRKLFFKVLDLSSSGMLLETSMSNRHLFPGMSLKNALLTFPGQEAIRTDVTIEDIRGSTEKNNFLLGVSVAGETLKFVDCSQAYLAFFALVKTTEKKDEKAG